LITARVDTILVLWQFYVANGETPTQE
jgi:hypothetical protein